MIFDIEIKRDKIREFRTRSENMRKNIRQIIEKYCPGDFIDRRTISWKKIERVIVSESKQTKNNRANKNRKNRNKQNQ